MPTVANISLPGLDPFPPSLSRELVSALEAQPKNYVPRTHHLRTAGEPKYINRLIHSISPYLLQHAHNPVNWFPWGQEAFAAARALNRPILLSVGYATCHWCHVMEGESFEDVEIAEYINRHFIAIKVDREERPDVDAVYMTAVQMATGGGGWPMTVFMTADGHPFFAGTYFPPRDGDRGARIGFLSILRRMSEAWENERDRVLSGASEWLDALQKATQPQVPDELPTVNALISAAQFLARAFDPVWGGFHRAPKFPRPSTYELLLRYGLRSNDEQAKQIVAFSLKKMSAGGIYDHLGGGFARYSTDREWLVPHFEKMLYDNAQLSILLAEAIQNGLDPSFENVLRDTLDYVVREMTNEGGGFYSATDADSEGVEGKFFVWSKAEIMKTLAPPDAKLFSEVYGVSEEGNFEGQNILHLAKSVEHIASEQKVSIESVQQSLRVARNKLYIAREQREHPLLDNKILTEWNALMISAMTRASFVLGEQKYLDAAVKAMEFVLNELRDNDGELMRAWRRGKTSGQTVLEDYAYMVGAALDLFEVTGSARWLEISLDLSKRMLTQFWDKTQGGFFATSTQSETLLVRDKPSYDGAQPSGNSVAALNLLRIHTLTLEEQYRELADKTILAFAKLLNNGAVQNPKMAQALDWRLDKARQIVIVTHPKDGGEDLVDTLRKTFIPNSVRIIGDQATLNSLTPIVPWLEGKVPLNEKATAFVCFEGTCKLPVNDSSALLDMLKPEVPIEAPPLTIRSPG